MKKIFLLAAITLVGFASCDLTEMPVTATDTDKALANYDGLDDATALAYAAFRGEGWYGSYTSIMPDVMCGNCVAGDPMDSGRGQLFNIWNFTAESGWATWSNAYSNILRCNNVIYRIQTMRDTYLAEDGVTDQMLDNIMAECLFIRAYSYFDLVRWYGADYDPATANDNLGVPIADVDPQVSAVAKPARETLAKNYAEIVADLENALSLMDPAYSRAGVREPKAACSYHVIEALLARVYLYMHEYAKAEKMATNVISSGLYSVANARDYQSMWSESSWAATGEIIFCAYVAQDEGGTSPGMITNPNGYGDVRVSQDLIDIMEPNDVRYTMLLETPTYPDYRWPAKYLGKGDGLVNYSNLPLIRTSEMYLIRAEARYRLNADGAVEDLNQVATNRGLSPYGAITDDDLFDELRREFAFEGHIYHNYKRFGRNLDRTDVLGTQNIDLLADSYLWLMPISQSEIDVNGNLKQNPGY